MWFKNLRLFRFTEAFDLTPAQLHQALSAHAFKPCRPTDTHRYGWSFPLGQEGSEYVHTAAGYTMIRAKREDKILPSAVVKEHLDQKVEQIKSDEGRPVGRKERQSLKDEIVFSLLPQAFSKSSFDYAYLAPGEDLIVVNSASARRAEDLLSLLRESLGSLKVTPLVPRNAPTQVMTDWLRSGEPPADFTLGDHCELQAGKDDRVIRCRHQDLTAPEIQSHLDSGMYVSRLALSWKDRIHFALDEQFALKQLKYEDQLRDEAQDRSPESAAEAFDAEFAIMTGELSGLLTSLLKPFGGPAET